MLQSLFCSLQLLTACVSVTPEAYRPLCSVEVSEGTSTCVIPGLSKTNGYKYVLLNSRRCSAVFPFLIITWPCNSHKPNHSDGEFQRRSIMLKRGFEKQINSDAVVTGLRENRRIAYQHPSWSHIASRINRIDLIAQKQYKYALIVGVFIHKTKI